VTVRTVVDPHVAVLELLVDGRHPARAQRPATIRAPHRSWNSSLAPQSTKALFRRSERVELLGMKRTGSFSSQRAHTASRSRAVSRSKGSSTRRGCLRFGE